MPNYKLATFLFNGFNKIDIFFKSDITMYNNHQYINEMYTFVCFKNILMKTLKRRDQLLTT